MSDSGAMDEDPAYAAFTQVARDVISDLVESRALELAAGMTGQDVTGGQPPRDSAGQFQPPSPRPSSGWSHTLRHPANRTHLLGADEYMRELYGRGAAGILSGPEQPQEASPAPEVPAAELDRRGVYQAARAGRRRGRSLRYSPGRRPAARRPAAPFDDDSGGDAAGGPDGGGLET